MVSDDEKKGFNYRDLPQVAKVLEHCFIGIQNGKVGIHKTVSQFVFQFELIEAIQALLEVLKVPFEKEKASDESKQVPNMPILFNALCPLIRYEIPSESDEDIAIVQKYDKICVEVANVVTAVASYGI